MGFKKRPPKLTPERIDELLEQGRKGLPELNRQLSRVFRPPPCDLVRD